MSTYTVKIEGMSCGHCVGHVRKALQTVRDLQVVDVKVGEAKIEADDAVAQGDVLRRAIDDAGYRVLAVTRFA
jgi:copper chaperone CopZ